MLLAVVFVVVLAWTTTSAALICPTLRLVNITVSTDFKEGAIVENLPDLLANNNGAHLFISSYKIANNDVCEGLLLSKNNIEVSFSIVDAKVSPSTIDNRLMQKIEYINLKVMYSFRNV